jgi:hypothetical protein
MSDRLEGVTKVVLSFVTFSIYKQNMGGIWQLSLMIQAEIFCETFENSFHTDVADRIKNLIEAVFIV